MEINSEELSMNAMQDDFNACINGHGLYNSFQFVLRLSPEVHRRLSSYSPGITSGVKDPEDIRAFSTYLHETVHWWQHVGSSAGFLMSLSYPAQAHANYHHLKSLLLSLGPKKSIRRLIESRTDNGGLGTPTGTANIVANNFFDIEFFRRLVTDPKAAPKIVNDPLFNWAGHCYEIGYGNILGTLSRSVDREFEILPDARGWENEFQKLRDQKATGFYLGSEIHLAPIGTLEIFEGQARFTQLQYLYFASRGKLTWDQVAARQMLTARYREAFDTFLKLTEFDWPATIDDPLVGLFLLICDIAINPGAGFPMPITFFSTFMDDVNPGMRFLFLCRAIAKNRVHFRGAISKYSRDEYAEVSAELTRPLLIHHPLLVAKTVAKWSNCNQSFTSLMSYYESFQYPPENLPVSLLLSHFIAFNVDKFKHPEYFCWPGAWMVGDRVTAEIATIFDRHCALFVDKEDEDGIFPRILAGRNEKYLYETFQAFYEFIVTYDMTRQWISVPGEFRYDYRWLSSTATEDSYKKFATSCFMRAYGVSPGDFELL
jgi:hypothetical protein